ncbi:MAG: hypothetical protein EU535_03280 [Promethearchaeota archaeon]|nr:MAG: hypothetical protein EU535_03280 [Candidatus Lokiarchaeota archaeon]
MVDTDRTTISLAQFYMDCVEDCIGVLGTSKAQVISKIVEIFFDKPENIDYIEKLKKKRKIAENKKLISSDIEKKIVNFLKFSNNIPIDDFIDFLNIDKEHLRTNISNWAEKFNFRYDNQKIIKNI